MPTTEAPTRARREGLRAAWILLLSLIALVPIAVWSVEREPGTPAEVVAAFLEALRVKDLDAALAYIDAPVPAGVEATFLRPDALSDEWEVLEVRASEPDPVTDPEVEVTIGHPEGTAQGVFTVHDVDGQLSIDDPFQTVAFEPSPHLALQVNDYRFDLDPVFAAAPLQLSATQFRLLPGVYRFFGGDPVAFLPSGGYGDDVVAVAPPAPAPTPAHLESAQRAVEDLIDACVEYELPAPVDCPFGTDGRVDTVGRERMAAVEEVAWKVERYPVVEIVTAAGMSDEPTLVVGFAEPGRLELTGRGSPDHDHWREFTAACRFGGENLEVMLGDDGEAALVGLGATAGDTCRGTE